MHYHKPAGNMLWIILFFLAATFGFNACSDVNNVSVPSKNANLSALTVTPGTLQPAFSNDVTDYTVNVASSVTSVTVTAKPQDAEATVRINGQTTTSRSVSLEAAGSSTPITIVVTAVNESQQTYLVTVNRAPFAGNINLQSLTVSPGTLTPPFTANTTGYTVDVASTVASVTVTAQPQDAGATITINEQTTTSLPVTLGAEGSSMPITIVVTAPNGNQKTYVVTVNRAALGGNNNLSSLTVSPGTLAPAFAASTLNYSVNVASGVSSVTVTATLQDTNASMMVDGQGTSSGQARTITLGGPGSSTPITIEVTAPNGDKKTYSVTVNRAAIVLSGNNNLSALVVSAGALVPDFDAATTNYAVLAPNSTTDTTITATVADSTATLTINGSPATSGVPSASIPLVVGPNNPIPIVVTAENGTQKTYTVIITREP
jgi:Cadherin-like beta sandwich domain